MKGREVWVIAPLLCFAAFGPGQSWRTGLSFEDRVEAQRAIESVYYAHQIGAELAFDEAVPRDVLQKKVRTYLKESVALEKLWGTRVTAEALEREWERISRDARFPDRLKEIQEALDNDPVQVQECPARSTLVDRLAHDFFDWDSRIHDPVRREAEDLRQRLAGGDDEPATDDGNVILLELQQGPGSASERGSARRTISQRGRPQVTRLVLDPVEFKRWRSRLPERAGEVGAV